MAYDPTLPEISKIVLPSGNPYNIKDLWSRERIVEISSLIQGGVHYIGKTTTPLSGDGDTTLSVVIDGKTVEAKQGDMVSLSAQGKQDLEFLFNGSAWYELGSTGSLKAFAFVDKGEFSTTYTPAGTFSAELLAGRAEVTATYTPGGNVGLTTESQTLTSESYTPAGTITQPVFSNGEASVSATYTPGGTVELTGSTTEDVTIQTVVSEDGNYTPGGTISTPTFSNGTINGTTSYDKVTSVVTD